MIGFQFFSPCVHHLSASPKLAIILNHQGRTGIRGQHQPRATWLVVLTGSNGTGLLLASETCYLWDIFLGSLGSVTSGHLLFIILLSVLSLPLRTVLNLSTVSLLSLSMLQATTSRPSTFMCWFSSCWSPYLCPFSISIVFGANQEEILPGVQSLFLCLHSLVISHLIQLQVIRSSLLLSVFSGLTFCGSPVTRMLWTSVSPKLPHPEILILECSLWSLHGLSPYFLQVFGHMSLF